MTSIRFLGSCSSQLVHKKPCKGIALYQILLPHLVRKAIQPQSVHGRNNNICEYCSKYESKALLANETHKAKNIHRFVLAQESLTFKSETILQVVLLDAVTTEEG